MTFPPSRARGAALVFAAALASAAMAPSARAEDGRVVTVQANPELQKRAEALFKGATDGGAKVSWGALEAGATPEGLIVKDIKVTSPDNKTMTIEQLEIRAYDWANPKEPRHADMSMKRFVIAASSLDASGAENFKELGLEALTVNGEIAFKFDEKEKAFDVSKLVLDFTDLGELRLRLKLTGITPADLKGEGAAPKPPAGAAPKPGQPDAMMGVLSRLNLSGATIAFKDKSLVERMIRADAKKKSLTEQANKAKILEELGEERGKAEDDMTKEFIEAAIKFIKSPGEIELAANPPAPANVMMAFMMVMGNRGQIKELLGISIAVK